MEMAEGRIVRCCGCRDEKAPGTRHLGVTSAGQTGWSGAAANRRPSAFPARPPTRPPGRRDARSAGSRSSGRAPSRSPASSWMWCGRSAPNSPATSGYIVRLLTLFHRGVSMISFRVLLAPGRSPGTKEVVRCYIGQRPFVRLAARPLRCGPSWHGILPGTGIPPAAPPWSAVCQRSRGGGGAPNGFGCSMPDRRSSMVHRARRVLASAQPPSAAGGKDALAVHGASVRLAPWQGSGKRAAFTDSADERAALGAICSQLCVRCDHRACSTRKPAGL
jgi:hypothetical protein